MKINKKLIFLFAVFTIILSCSDEKIDNVIEEPKLSKYQIETIAYFKEIALGFEFGNASEITRKWNDELKIFIGGNPNKELLTELDTVISEINSLVTNGFKIRMVKDSLQSNYYLFFGKASSYAERFPSQKNLVKSNWGLFSLYWDANNNFTSGHMYVDIERADPEAQKHLLREELTQSLGLAKDSKKYPESIFQSSWTTTNTYLAIDKELIRLLYHPKMKTGLNSTQVDNVLQNILNNE